MKQIVRRVAISLLLVVAALLVAGFRADRDPADLEARSATAPSKFVDVGGARVHYRDRGSGPVVVLLHGSNSSLFTWEGWVSALASSYRVVTLDLPGHGLTGPDPRGRYSLAEMAEFVEAFASAIGLQRFTIGGNSMGGGVAWHYALLHPDRVQSLVLVDAAGLPREEPKPFAFSIASVPVLGWVTRWETPRFVVAGSVRDAYGDPSKVTDGLVDLYEDMLRREGNRAATHERFLKPSDDLDGRLEQIHAPTLILWGSRDRWILPKYAERFHARIPGAKLVTLEGLGHIGMEEDPIASVSPVKDFLAAVGRSGEHAAD